MGKYNLTALRVRQRAIAQKSVNKVNRLPCWVDVMSDIPPSTTLVQNQAQQHPVVRQRVKTIPGTGKNQLVLETEQRRQPQPKKTHSLYKPKEVRYEEDQLRKEFFRDHPWELARPRVILENDGKDYQRYNWNNLQQKNRHLDGESVVQRQLHLLNNVPDMTKAAAYDIARREFYNLRLQEDVERRVAQEEAQATGAYFGMSANNVGMELENQEFDRWRVWAEKEAQIQDQRAAAFAGITSPTENETESTETAENPEADAGAEAEPLPIRPGEKPQIRSNRA